MGLLDYQAMPSLRDVAHDEWLCNVYDYYPARSWAGSRQGNRYGTEMAGGTAHPSRTKSHLPGQTPPASQAGGRVGPAL